MVELDSCDIIERFHIGEMVIVSYVSLFSLIVNGESCNSSQYLHFQLYSVIRSLDMRYYLITTVVNFKCKVISISMMEKLKQNGIPGKHIHMNLEIKILYLQFLEYVIFFPLNEIVGL